MRNLPTSFDQLVRTIDRYRSMKQGELPFPQPDVIVPKLDDVLSGVSPPFFVWVHLMDPHSPFLPVSRRDEYNDLRVAKIHGILETNQQKLSEEDRKFVSRLYRSRVESTDEHIGEILDLLDSHGYYDDSLTWIVADHGEELGERGFIGHSHLGAPENLYAETTHIPSILRAPSTDIEGGVPSSHLDIVSTIGDWFDVDVSSECMGDSLLDAEVRDFQGRDLWTMNRMDPIHSVSVTQGKWRYIHRYDSDGDTVENSELYDIENDPRMERDVAGKNRRS
ncbi:sulfatase [Halosimplex aquaticum]